MSIPFTQYLRPHGHPRAMSHTGQPPEVEKKAHDLIAAGCVFEIEELTTGMISMTCERRDKVLGHEICPNGPPVVEAVRTLVETAYKRWERWNGKA